MPRPNRDRVMVSHYISRSDREAIDKLATETNRTKADTYRELLRLGLAAHASGVIRDDPAEDGPAEPSPALREVAKRPRATSSGHLFDAQPGTLRCKECGIPKGQHP